MVTKGELGMRLKALREELGLTQAQVADGLSLSRGALAQIELGQRAPNSLQLARLAEIYEIDIGELLSDQGVRERDAVAALFRSDDQFGGDPAGRDTVRRCAQLAREFTRLEELLGLSADRVSPAEYEVPQPRNRWEAIQQGERLAEAERDRLKLGDGSVRDLREVLEAQGLRAFEATLPVNVSGIFLNDSRYGLSIIINEGHHPRRRRFSFSHEYCHSLVDRRVSSLVSKEENRSELSEVRANAFAAAFLMPEAGVRSFVRSIGKGGGRSVLQVYDEEEALVGQRRAPAASQEIQLFDVVHLAYFFGVSFESGLYRLLNLGLITEEDRSKFGAQRDLANQLRSQLFGPEEEEPVHRSPHFLWLGLEALRRGEISRSKLRELGGLASAPDEFYDLADQLEDEKDEIEVLLPQTRDEPVR
jgi:Zn-dependent peptidase ImmA (M78 family)/DNA-binding XRE family transcriptional regulator